MSDRKEFETTVSTIKTLELENKALLERCKCYEEGIVEHCKASSADLIEIHNLKEAFDTKTRVHDQLNRDYIEVRDELRKLKEMANGS